MERAANWLLSVRVHVRNLRTHFPLNDVTGSEFIASRMRKCAQSASVSSQTSSKKKIRSARRTSCFSTGSPRGLTMFSGCSQILAHSCGEKLGFGLPQLRDISLKVWEQPGNKGYIHKCTSIICVSHEDNHLNICTNSSEK